MIKTLFIAVCFALSLNAAALAQGAGTPADQDALRNLKDNAVKVINDKDYALARQVLHEPFMATLITQHSFNDFDQLKAHFESLYTRESLRMKDIKLTAEADEASQIFSGTFAIARGATKEHYEMADGRTFDMDGRWTAVTMKDGDDWKILALHFGTNFLDNPVINAIGQGAKWTGLIGAIVGLIAGFAAGWFAKRRKITA